MGNLRNLAFWLVLFLLVVALFNVFSSGSNLTSSKEVSYSEFLIQVEKGNVSAVRLDGERIIVRDSGGNTYQVIQPSGASTVQKSSISLKKITHFLQELPQYGTPAFLEQQSGIGNAKQLLFSKTNRQCKQNNYFS